MAAGMARKDRAPNPPKRSQGPQRRATVASAADAERRRRTRILFGGSALAVAAAVLAIVFLTGSGGGEDERGALEDAGCTLQSFPAQENAPDHSDVPTLETKPKWNSSPPTSGPHFGQTAVWGVWDEEVPLVP